MVHKIRKMLQFLLQYFFRAYTRNTRSDRVNDVLVSLSTFLDFVISSFRQLLQEKREEDDRKETHSSRRLKVIKNARRPFPSSRCISAAPETDGVWTARDQRYCCTRDTCTGFRLSRAHEIGDPPVVNYSSSFTRRNFANCRPSIASFVPFRNTRGAPCRRNGQYFLTQ